MNHLQTFNEHVVSNKNLKNPKQEMINRVKQLCSYAVFEIKYKSGIFKREKTFDYYVWFTPKKIVIVEPEDTPIEIPFKSGDYFSDLYNWMSENNHELVYLKRKGNKNLNT